MDALMWVGIFVAISTGVAAAIFAALEETNGRKKD
jgi:hypothetical protein